MATSIPMSMSFEMLSTLPPESFVQYTKEIRPDQSVPSGRYYIGKVVGGIFQQQPSQRLLLGIRGAPNEFWLNTNAYLTGTAVAVSLPATYGGIQTEDAIILNKNNPPIQFNEQWAVFQGSRESFNSGGLALMDNQDTYSSFAVNKLRTLCTRRNRRGASLNVLSDLELGATPQANNGPNVVRTGGDRRTEEGLGSAYGQQVTAGPPTYSLGYSGGQAFKIPLGYYSNLVNTPSVIPVGLMASYSTNGFQIELATTSNENNFGRCYRTNGVPDNEAGNTPAGAGIVFTNEAAADTVFNYDVYLTDPRIVITMIRVLEPAVMDGVLSLYNKNEPVNVGGVSFPMSLRLNTIGYRVRTFQLSNTGTDYFFRVPCTDRSVRGYAFYIWSRNNYSKGILYTATTAGMGGNSNQYQTVKVVRHETKLGSESPHDVVEDNQPGLVTSNVDNFYISQLNRSACLFSPLPYYLEGNKSDGLQEDGLAWLRDSDAQTATDVFGLGGVSATHSNNSNYCNRDCWGMVSFENLDRREGDYSGQFQAAGKDLTNVGGIDISMRIGAVTLLTTAAEPVISSVNFKRLDALPTNQGMNITFLVAYDVIEEISPQGVMDITNSVL